MNIVLVQPPIGVRTVSTAPPVGIAYLAAILERDGHEVSCISCDVEELGAAETVAEILRRGPDVVGFSVASLGAVPTMAMIAELKGAVGTIVVGGPHPTIFPEEFLEAGADFVVRGEGEKTVVRLLECVEGSTPRESVDGLAFLDGETVVRTPDVTLISDLDELPFPAWRLLPVDKFRSDFKISNKSLPVLTSRGCPGKCVFCYKGLFGNRFRTRSPQSIIDELLYLKNDMRIEEFSIVDDNFVCNAKRAIETCRLMIENGIDLPWSLPSGVRVDMVTPDLLQWLRKAGCYRIGFGVESGNQDILYAIRKNVTKDQIRKAVAMAKEAGFITSAFFMIGNLGETEATVMDSIEFAIELNPDIAQFAVATPYPGTEMFDILAAQGKILSRDWGKYDSFSPSEPLFIHDNLDAESIARLLKLAYRRFYLRPGFIVRKLFSGAHPFKIGKTFRAGAKLLKLMRK